MVTVALDRDPERVRPWIERAAPTHPSLIDTDFLVADLYNMVNVPTAVWIDEAGRVVRPNDVMYGSDTFKRVHGLDHEAGLAALRAWVRDGALTLDTARVRELQQLPTRADQEARAEFAVARWLLQAGRRDAAERHFLRAGELAPHDFIIRRGSMPMRGIDSMGPAFREMAVAWGGAGNPYYRPLPE